MLELHLTSISLSYCFSGLWIPDDDQRRDDREKREQGGPRLDFVLLLKFPQQSS